MELNENNMSKYVIGSNYSYSYLISMTKYYLIDLLGIAQSNYEIVNERLFNVNQYAEKLDKALDKACIMLDYALKDKHYYMDDDGCLNCERKPFKSNEEWKEYLLNEAKA